LSKVLSSNADVINKAKALIKGKKMTVTAYQVNSVLNAYTRQSKVRISSEQPNENSSDGQYRDVVSLSVKESNKAEELEKISYNLRDVILKDKDI